jgi:hypothetical protein
VSQLLDIISAALTDLGIAHVRYLDDFWVIGVTEARAWSRAYKAAQTILEAALALSLPKVEGPAQCLEFLGIVVNSVTKTLSLPEARPFLRRIIDTIKSHRSGPISLSPSLGFRLEVRYWRDHISQWNAQRRIGPENVDYRVNYRVETDPGKISDRSSI